MFEHPFDLCKVRLQTQVLDQMARFNGPIDCLMKTWKNEGFRGLYRVHVLCLHYGDLVQVLTDYMRPSFFSAIGFTSANSGSNGRELVPLPIIQRNAESDPTNEPDTTMSGSDPSTGNLGCRRSWCYHKFRPVRPFLSSENSPSKSLEAHGRLIAFRSTALRFFFFLSHQNSRRAD